MKRALWTSAFAGVTTLQPRKECAQGDADALADHEIGEIIERRLLVVQNDELRAGVPGEPRERGCGLDDERGANRDEEISGGGELGGAAQKEYDIFFPQSVGGLANGSDVTFQGVPAGQVETIELWRQDPSFVRVRVSLNEEIPILQGTTASISASFTGVSTVSLGGAVKGAPAITEPGPEGVPVIPATPGGLGEILASAPLLLERVATLTDRLTRLLSDENHACDQGTPAG